MASISREILSGSTSGRPIKIAATATAGTLAHTAHATAKDEIWLWLANTTTADVIVTVEFGGVTSPDDLLKFTVPAGEVILAVAGLTLTGGLVVRAFAGTANVVNMAGYVNRIT